MNNCLTCRVIRKTDSPFGGIQLILCGDFLQLPPVTKGADKRKFAFEVRTFGQWSRMSIVYYLNIICNSFVYYI